MLNQQSQKLSYFLSQKKSILIVSLIGPLFRENALVFEECIKEVEASSAKWIILNFRDVPPPIHKAMIPPLARIQKIARSKQDSKLLVSSVHPELRKELIEAGVLRIEELTNNLADALKLVSQELREAA